MAERSRPPLRVERFERRDSAGSAWSAVREALGYPVPDDPIPDHHPCLIAFRGDRPLARAAFGVKEDLVGAPGRTGYVGWYEATEREAGVHLLEDAVRALKGEGVQRIVGPLNGSTWARYRLMLPPEAPGEADPPFLTEPRNPPEYTADFLAAGFQPRLEYESRRVARPTGDPEVEERLLPRLRERGIRVRDLDPDCFDGELRALYDLSIEAFAANPLYSPIDHTAFAAMYQGIRPLLDPRLVRLAVDPEGVLQGYVFAFTDPLSASPAPRIILKTLAAARSARGLGLGRVLVDDINRTAKIRGHEVIHAMMQGSNVSRAISERSDSTVSRRYTLYGIGAE